MISAFFSTGNVKISSAMKCKEPIDLISRLIHPSHWAECALQDLLVGAQGVCCHLAEETFHSASHHQRMTSNRTSEEIQWISLSSFLLSCFEFYSQEDLPFLSYDLIQSFLCALHLLFFSLYAHCLWMSKIAVSIWKEFRKEWRKKLLPFYFQFLCCVIQASIDMLA